MTSTLQSLLERVEACVEPDRELDAAIDIAMFGGETVWKQAKYTMDLYTMDLHPASRRPSKCHVGGFANEHVPLVTSSLDAALALVAQKLPGTYWYVCAGRARVGEPLYGAQIVGRDANGVSFDEPLGIAEHDRGAPLAVLSALLRALISKEQNGNG